jgi:hypothetical protein
MFDLPDRGFFGRLGGGLGRIFAGRDDPRLSQEENAAARSDALVQAGLAALAGGSQGNTSLNVLGQAGLAGQQFGAQARAGEFAINNQQQMAALAQQGPEALMQMFQHALASGDAESARAISEVLKSMGSSAGGYNGSFQTLPVQDPESGDWSLHRVLADPRSGQIIRDFGPDLEAQRLAARGGGGGVPLLLKTSDPESDDLLDQSYVQYDRGTGQTKPNPVQYGGTIFRPPSRLPTEKMSQARGFLNMFNVANQKIEDLMIDRGGRPFGRTESIMADLGLRELVSSQIQEFNTASGIIFESWLRMTTGAAYNTEEMQNALRTFIPQPNESAESLEYKKQLRERLYWMMRSVAGYRVPKGMEQDMYNLPPEVFRVLSKPGENGLSVLDQIQATQAYIAQGMSSQILGEYGGQNNEAGPRAPNSPQPMTSNRFPLPGGG